MDNSPGASGPSLACCLIVMFCGTQATAAVMDHLTDEKRKHSHMLWVNLQEELVLEGNGQMFTPREPSCLDQHISIPSSDPQLIEVEFKHVLTSGALEFGPALNNIGESTLSALLGL